MPPIFSSPSFGGPSSRTFVRLLTLSSRVHRHAHSGYGEWHPCRCCPLHLGDPFYRPVGGCWLFRVVCTGTAPAAMGMASPADRGICGYGAIFGIFMAIAFSLLIDLSGADFCSLQTLWLRIRFAFLLCWRHQYPGFTGSWSTTFELFLVLLYSILSVLTIWFWQGSDLLLFRFIQTIRLHSQFSTQNLYPTTYSWNLILLSHHRSWFSLVTNISSYLWLGTVSYIVRWHLIRLIWMINRCYSFLQLGGDHN